MRLMGTIHKSSLSGKIGKAKGGSALSDHIFALMENTGTATTTETIPDVADYTTTNSLSFDGTQYIVTDIIPTNNTKIEIDFMRTVEPNARFLFGSRSSGAHFALMYQGASLVYPMFADVTSQMSDSGATVNDVHTAAIGQDGYFLDGVLKKSFESAGFTGVYGLHIGTTNRSGTDNPDSRLFIGNIYAVRIYESGELVHELLPAESSGGDAGMYDIIGLQFYELQVSA